MTRFLQTRVSRFVSMRSRLFVSLCLLEKSLLDSLIPTRLLSPQSMSPSRSNPSSQRKLIRKQHGMFFGPRSGGVTGQMPIEWEGGLIASEEPLQAFRAWYAKAFDGSHYLLPLYSDYPPWSQFRRMEALCPHVLKERPHRDPPISPFPQPGQFASSQRHRSLSTYVNHVRYLEHPIDEPAPHAGCSCGLYVLKSMTAVGPQIQPSTLGQAVDIANGAQVSVVGSVRIWGRVIEHERGYRAQYAYPERLFILLPSGVPAPPPGGEGALDTGVGTVVWHQQRMLQLWKQALEQNYGVPVGFVNRADLEALGRALAD